MDIYAVKYVIVMNYMFQIKILAFNMDCAINYHLHIIQVVYYAY